MAVLQLRRRADGALRVIGDVPEKHAFSDKYVAKCVQDGSMSLSNPSVGITEGYERNPVLTGSDLIIHTEDGDIQYIITEPPGKYGDRVSHEYQVELVTSKVKRTRSEEE